MIDLSDATFKLINWFLYVGIALSVGAIAASIAFLASGDITKARRLFISGLAGLLLGASASEIFNSLTSNIPSSSALNLPSSADFILYAIVAALLVSAILFFALGKREEGVNYAIAAVLAAGFIAMIPAVQALFNGQNVAITGTCILDANVSPTQVHVGQPVNVTVKMPYGSGSYNLNVNFGDGKTASGSISPGGITSFIHIYQDTGVHTVTLKATGNGSCSYALALNVGQPPSPWFLGPFNLGGYMSSINSIFKFPIYMLYSSPEFDLGQNSEDMKLYTKVTAVAIAALGLFFAIRVVSGFLNKDPSTSLVDSIKEAILVLVVIMLAPYLYNTFAYLCNQASSLVVDKIDIMPSIATLVGIIAASAILGVATSFAGTFGGTLAVAFMLSAFTAMIRYFLIKAIIYAAPLLAVSYLFPAARGVAKFFMNVLAGLVLAGPVAAFVLAGFTTVGGPANVVGMAVAPMVTFMGFPLIFSLASGASPGGVAYGFSRMVSGAFAGISGRGTSHGFGGIGATTIGRERGTGGGGGMGSMGSDFGTASERGVGENGAVHFVHPEDYEYRSGQGAYTYVSGSAASRTPPYEPRPELGYPLTTSSNSAPQPPPSSPPPEPGSGSESGSGPNAAGEGAPTSPGQSPEYRGIRGWWSQHVTNKTRPRWDKVVAKVGPWLTYGHHTVHGGRHPIREVRHHEPQSEPASNVEHSVEEERVSYSDEEEGERGGGGNHISRDSDIFRGYI